MRRMENKEHKFRQVLAPRHLHRTGKRGVRVVAVRAMQRGDGLGVRWGWRKIAPATRSMRRRRGWWRQDRVVVVVHAPDRGVLGWLDATRQWRFAHKSVAREVPRALRRETSHLDLVRQCAGLRRRNNPAPLHTADNVVEDAAMEGENC